MASVEVTNALGGSLNGTNGVFQTKKSALARVKSSKILEEQKLLALKQKYSIDQFKCYSRASLNIQKRNAATIKGATTRTHGNY